MHHSHSNLICLCHSGTVGTHRLKNIEMTNAKFVIFTYINDYHLPSSINLLALVVPVSSVVSV